MEQSTQQAFIVALMQTDGRFIQHIHHPDQAGPNLARQTNTLCFTTGECFRGTGQGKVVQADIHQKTETFNNLFQDFLGNLRPLTVQLQVPEEVQGFPDRHFGNLRQRHARYIHMTRFLTQTAALTARTGLIGDIFRQLFAHTVGFGFAVATLHIMQHAFKRVIAHHHITTIVHVTEFYRGVATAVQHHFFRLRTQRIKRFIQIKLVMISDRFQHLEVIKTAFIPATDRAAGQTQFRIGHHFMRIKILLHTQAITARTGTGRVVEREQPRFQFTQGIAAFRTGEVRGENQRLRFVIVHIRNINQSTG